MNELIHYLRIIADALRKAEQSIYTYIDTSVNAFYVQDIERQNYITIVDPLTQTTGGRSTPFTFSRPVNRITLQNNTSANVYYAFDEGAGLHSLLLSPGSFLYWQKKVRQVHIYTVAAQNVNQDNASNIVLLGAL